MLVWRALQWWLPRAGFLGLAKAIARKIARDGLHGFLSALRFHLQKFQDEQVLYEKWLAQTKLSDEDLEQFRLKAESFAVKPVFSIVMPVYNAEARWLRRAIESVLAQAYPWWELCVADDASTATRTKPLLEEYRRRDSRIKVIYRPQIGHISAATNTALCLATGEYIVLLDQDDEIAPEALFELAKQIDQDVLVDMVYSDEDKISEQDKRLEPFFKPDWSPEYLEGCMYTGRLACYRTQLVRDLGGFREGFDGAQEYDFVLRFTERATQIRHVAKVLYHSRSVRGATDLSTKQKDHVTRAVCRTLSDRLNRTSRRGEVTSSEYPGCFCIDEEISACPLVSVVIPSAGKDAVIRGKVTDLLANCVTSIDERTDYENFELIVVDNDDLRPRTRDIAERCGCELVHFREPFNVARKMNLGARRAQGEYLLFLNDDIETIDATWLRHMLQIAQRDGIGVVGAKLLFEDGTLQHVGVTFDDDGLPGHVLRGYPGQHPGYFFSNCSPRNYLAVTGACMLTRRELFEQVGGFNERFAVNFNDVDYCLRCHEAGYRIVFAPRARLYHFESRTREPTVAAEEVDLFKQLWADITKADPYYSRLMDNKPPKFLPRVMDGPLHSARRASGTAKGLAKDASAQKQSA